MENKKTKLTISGNPKKTLRNFDTTKSQVKKTVKINNQINKPANKTKLGILKKNISKRYEAKTISEDQRDGLLTLILEKEDS